MNIQDTAICSLRLLFRLNQKVLDCPDRELSLAIPNHE
jgi:hypothetical protein